MNFAGKYKDLIQSDKLHVLSLSVLIDSLTNSRGGTAANIAYNLALLKESPILLASIGSDSKQYLNDLSTMGVKTENVNVSDKATATYTVLTDSDDNQIGGFFPGAMADSGKLSIKKWHKDKSLVVISANDPECMDKLVKECIKYKIDYVYDLGQQVTNISPKQMTRGVQHAKILMVNDYELGAIVGRAGIDEIMLTKTIPIIVTTLGARGSRITGSLVKNPVIIPGVKGIKVVDPTGAGDAYRAGFLYGYVRGWELSICASLASVIATYTIAKHGTQTHTFSVADIRKLHYSAYGTHLPK